MVNSMLDDANERLNEEIEAVRAWGGNAYVNREVAERLARHNVHELYGMPIVIDDNEALTSENPVREITTRWGNIEPTNITIPTWSNEPPNPQRYTFPRSMFLNPLDNNGAGEITEETTIGDVAPPNYIHLLELREMERSNSEIHVNTTNPNNYTIDGRPLSSECMRYLRLCRGFPPAPVTGPAGPPNPFAENNWDRVSPLRPRPRFEPNEHGKLYDDIDTSVKMKLISDESEGDEICRTYEIDPEHNGPEVKSFWETRDRLEKQGLL